MQLTNVTITNPKHIKTGTKTTAEGKSWDWHLWNVTINGDRYTFFPRKGYTPQDGDQMIYVEYEESQDVGSDGTVYNNRTIKDYKPVAVQEAKPNAQPATQVATPNNNGLNISYCLSYCKDLVCAVISGGAEMELSDYVSLIVKLAKQMQTEATEETTVVVETRPAQPNAQVSMAKFFDSISKLKGDCPTPRLNSLMEKFGVKNLGDIVDYKAQVEFYKEFKRVVEEWEIEKLQAPPVEEFGDESMQEPIPF